MKDSEKKVSREEELDRFWDIGSLLPQKKKPVPPSASSTETTEIELEPVEASEAPTRESDAVRRFIPPHTAEEQRAAEPQEEYSPENALLRRVRIFRHKSNYRYYDDFVRDAVRLYPIHGEECERVTFFSYVPQYSQMNRAQLEWYLWWRECVRGGTYPQTDYSYILLYVYELINLSGRLDAERVRDALLDVWEHYREMYRQLDGYLSEWICDFCLLHRLSLPSDLSPELLSAAMSHCNLKEFYISSNTANGYVGALLAFCNNYDYRKSKFCAGENKALFDRHIPSVVEMVIDTMSRDGKLFASTKMDDSRVMRHAYTGALCAWQSKRNIEVEYCSFSRSNELRYFITDVVKYTENLLRAYLGIRSRLSVYSLPTSVREQIDRYMADALPPRVPTPRVKKVAPPPAYERLYDIEKKPLSLSHAAEIERASWDTTERLIETFSEENEEETQPMPEPIPELPIQALACEEPDEMHARMKPYTRFLRAVQDEDYAAQKVIAREMGKLIDAVADEINEIAVEIEGDILIEGDGEGYLPIPDYLDLLSAFTEMEEK